MKIALVSPYDFVFPGGVNSHISSLAHQFAKMGHTVKIIAPASRDSGDLGDNFIRVGKPVSFRTSGSIARVSTSTRLAPRLKVIFNEEKFDIIHLHEPLLPMLCTSVLRSANTATVGTFHAWQGKPGYDFFKPFGRLTLKKWYFCKLQGKIAVSKPAAEYASRHFPGYYNIIPNGIDVEHFSPDVSPIDRFCDGKLNILFVGRLESRKGLNYLLEAYQRVKGEIPNSRLIVVGDGGRLRKKYEKWVARNGVEGVVFVGYVPYNELPRYYKAADVFCAPSTGRESFGIVLLEAMAVGKPIVASNIDGYANVVSHNEEGLLVPPKDVEKLARMLLRLMTDESLRRQMGDRGRVKAQEYSWEHIAQRLLSYYDTLLSERRLEKRFPERETASPPSN